MAHTNRECECAGNMAVSAHTELACLSVRIALPASLDQRLSHPPRETRSVEQLLVFFLNYHVKCASWNTIGTNFCTKKIHHQRWCVKTDVRKRRQWLRYQANVIPILNFPQMLYVLHKVERQTDKITAGGVTTAQ
jgi:hypothetical protein